MQPLSTMLIEKLNLRVALAEEAEAKRNLLPREVGWAEVQAEAVDVVKWIRTELRAGWIPAPQQTVAARKPRHGVRPVAVWAIPDRIIYRALVNTLLVQEPDLDRSSTAYLSFVRAPHTYSESVSTQDQAQKQAAFLRLYDSPFSHVVKSDISAFYQYIDHSILARELMLKGQDYDLVDSLIQLLREAQGRTYGLPQLLDPSDRLSEIYIDRVERALLRVGLCVWRYNDDFRIGCRDYAEALNAIEQLDSAARENGLVINESKTLTYGYETYVVNHLGLTVSSDQNVIAGDEVEDVVGDYTDEFGLDDVQVAAVLIAGAQPGAGDQQIDIKGAHTTDIRLLRRAFNGLAAAKSDQGIEHVKRLMEFVPSLTPTLTRYLILVASTSNAKVHAVLDAICQQTSLNEWQKIWIIHGLSQVGATTGESSIGYPARLQWVSNVANTSPSPVTRAMAWYCLAEANAASIGELVEKADAAPTCLRTHYLAAVRVRLSGTSGSEQQKRIVDALAGDNVLSRAILQ
jgi:Reverse transcriptase (RNA-dependent DNA polymerase)